MVLKTAAVVTTVVMTQETMVIEAVALSSVTRTIVTTGGAVISTRTADIMTRRPRNVSTRTTHMDPTSGTGTSTNRLADSPTRSPWGLAMAEVVEEADSASVSAEAVDEAVPTVYATLAAEQGADHAGWIVHGRPRWKKVRSRRRWSENSLPRGDPAGRAGGTTAAE